jgi:hypothetical protein
VGPRIGLNFKKKRKISCPYRESNPKSSAHSPVVIPTELFRILNLEYYPDMSVRRDRRKSWNISFKMAALLAEI